MKIFLSTLMIAALATGIVACSGKTEKADENNAEQSETTPAKFSPNSVTIGVVDLDDDNILRPGIETNHVIAIDFNATWCGPCQQFKPAFDAAAEKYAGEIEFISVDVDKNPETATAFEVTSIPHVVIIKPGTEPKDYQNYIGTGDLLPQEKFFEMLDKANGK